MHSESYIKGEARLCKFGLHRLEYCSAPIAAFDTGRQYGLICMLWVGSDNAYSHAALIVSSWLTAQSLTSTDVTRYICLPHKETGN
jgi:hypothetical protein